MKFVACAGLAMSLIAGAASAGDWRLVSVGRSGATAVDVTSVVRSGDIATGWTAVFLPIRRDGMDYALIRQEYGCRETTSTFLSVVSYDEDGQVVDRSDRRRPTISIAPDSNEILMMKAVCSGEFQVPDVEGWDSAKALLRDYRTTPPQ